MKYFILLLSFPLFAQTQYEVVPEKYWITDSNFEEKVNKEITALLSDEAVANIIDNSVSKEEAQGKLRQFLI